MWNEQAGKIDKIWIIYDNLSGIIMYCLNTKFKRDKSIFGRNSMLYQKHRQTSRERFRNQT